MWKEENNCWKYFGEDMKQLTGWFKDSDGRWFYLFSDDIAKGWFKDYDRRWYYFATEKSVINGEQYYKGQMVTGWLKDGEDWYYLLPVSEPDNAVYSGQMICNCEREINGTKYSFGSNGKMIKNVYKCSDNGIMFIEGWEGFIGKKYDDGTGVCTQGYGMTGKEIASLPNYVSKETAHDLLVDWLERKYTPVIVNDLKERGVSLSENQLDSLISFAYNCGTAGLLGSSLYKYICQGGRDKEKIMSYFCMWKNAGSLGPILERRRVSEANLFNNADYTGNK